MILTNYFGLPQNSQIECKLILERYYLPLRDCYARIRAYLEHNQWGYMFALFKTLNDEENVLEMILTNYFGLPQDLVSLPL